MPRLGSQTAHLATHAMQLTRTHTGNRCPRACNWPCNRCTAPHAESIQNCVQKTHSIVTESSDSSRERRSTATMSFWRFSNCNLLEHRPLEFNAAGALLLHTSSWPGALRPRRRFTIRTAVTTIREIAVPVRFN
jgi:hypothetical protein